MPSKRAVRRGVYAAVLFVLFCIAGFFFALFLHHEKMIARTAEQKSGGIQNLFRPSSLKHSFTPCAAPLFSNTDSPVSAQSAIVVDAKTGTVVFEKNADLSIPPASLTKLVGIYVIMQAITAGVVSLNDIIIPPPQSWAVNIPPGSSLMFLGPRQRLTLEELIRGMAVVSGNDAAVAAAQHVAGSVPEFVKQMNAAVKALGLTHTEFVEPTGLSELNKTTAREFALFAFWYLKHYPENLTRFHAHTALSYPQPHNTMVGEPPITQSATNTLLKTLQGCDGLKTGFIYESGFNLSLTAQRNGTRFLTVLLGGPGNTISAGKRIRDKDGAALIEAAFTQYKTEQAQVQPALPPSLIVIGGNENALCPIARPDEHAQFFFTQSVDDAAVFTLSLPKYIPAPIHAGAVIGHLFCRSKNTGELLQQWDIISDRTVARASKLKQTLDFAAIKIFGEPTAYSAAPSFSK